LRLLFKFLSLRPRDRALLINATLLLAIAKLGLRLLPFQTLRRLLSKLERAETPPQFASPALPLQKIVWAVEVASRYIPGGEKCLPRALVAHNLLVRQGFAAQLRIGVAKDAQGQLEAHAWVESQGKVAIGRIRNWERFVPLPNFE